MSELIISGGTVVTETGIFAADIAVEDGRIKAIGRDVGSAATERIDASGLHVLPGLIDVHVHFREPGMTQKEDWLTGSTAAAMGGVTTVFEMPNTSSPVDTVAHLELKRQTAESKSVVDFGLYGVLAEDNVQHLEPLIEAGVIGFKLFLGNTTGNLPCPSDGAVLEGFEILARRGLRCSIHAEKSPILFWREARLKAAGRNTARDHLLARTDVCALEALSKSCVLAEWTGARIHIVHESSALSLPYIRWFKSRGVDLTVETLPQYLYRSIEDMEAMADGHRLRMNPPIRERWHQDLLWAALADGTIDLLGTDHAPHAPAEKEGATIWEIACGFPGVESALALMLTGVAEGRLSLPRLVQITSAAPARAFGLAGRKGSIVPGADADFVLVDLGRRETLATERLHSRGKLSAYEGMTVTGWPVATIRRGLPIMADGRLLAAPGSGRLLRPAMPAPAPRNVDKHLATLCP